MENPGKSQKNATIGLQEQGIDLYDKYMLYLEL